MNPNTHILNLPRRKVTLQVSEEPTRILVKMSVSKTGEFGDELAILSWMGPIVEKYDTDKRPTVLENQDTGEVVSVFGDAHSSVAVVKI